VNIRSLQAYLKTKDYQPELRIDYFLKLVEEIGELSEAIRKNQRETIDGFKGSIEEELWDVIYYTLCLANIYDIDLERWIRVKEQLNDEKYGTNNAISLPE